MSGVARQLHLIVLNYVLLNDSLAGLLALRLLNNLRIEVYLWNEAVVAWDVLGHLGGADSQIIVLVFLLSGIRR